MTSLPFHSPISLVRREKGNELKELGMQSFKLTTIRVTQTEAF